MNAGSGRQCTFFCTRIPALNKLYLFLTVGPAIHETGLFLEALHSRSVLPVFNTAHRALLIPSDVNVGICNPAVQMSVHFLVDELFKSLPGFKPGGYVELAL